MKKCIITISIKIQIEKAPRTKLDLHTIEKQYYCNQCTKLVSWYSSLKKYIRSDKDEKCFISINLTVIILSQ